MITHASELAEEAVGAQKQETLQTNLSKDKEFVVLDMATKKIFTKHKDNPPSNQDI